MSRGWCWIPQGGPQSSTCSGHAGGQHSRLIGGKCREVMSLARARSWELSSGPLVDEWQPLLHQSPSCVCEGCAFEEGPG